ncbi:MAG: M23 family metallopeptidase [Bacillota bacterium]
MDEKNFTKIIIKIISKIIKSIITFLITTFSSLVIVIIFIVIIIMIPFMLFMGESEKQVDLTITVNEKIEEYNSHNKEKYEYLELENEYKKIEINRNYIEFMIAYITLKEGQEKSIKLDKNDYEEYIEDYFTNEVKKKNRIKKRDGYKTVYKRKGDKLVKVKKRKYKHVTRRATIYEMKSKEKIKKKLKHEEKEQLELYVKGIRELLGNRKVIINENKFIFPVKGDDPTEENKVVKITSGYGWRIHPITNQKQFHGGIDISKATGVKVVSPSKLEITETGNHKTMGNYIKGKTNIRSKTYEFHFLHLDTINVNEGETVKKNQKIGTVGNTGRSTGSHLDFRIKRNGSSIDPLRVY